MVTEIRIIKQTANKTTAGGILLYIATHLSYKCQYDLNIISIKIINKPTFIEIVKLYESFTDIHLWIC